MKITSLNFNYFDSLFERLNNCETSKDDRIDILKAIITIQGTTISILEKRLEKLIDIIEN